MRSSATALLLFITFLSSLSSTSQQPPSKCAICGLSDAHKHSWAQPTPPHFKAENGLILSWISASVDSSKNDVTVLDNHGHALTTLSVLRLVPEAVSASIYDVSARSDQIIAVAVVYRAKKNSIYTTAAALFTFDFSGRLLTASALAAWREIWHLELDEHSNIWTITSHPGSKTPAQVPMVVKYDSRGNILEEMLTRDRFPLHARGITENSSIGGVGSGYEGGKMWFWLPGSSDFVTIETDSGNIAITKTGLPQGRVVPMRMVRQSSGKLIAEAQVFPTADRSSVRKEYFSWSPQTSWSHMQPLHCETGRNLIGENNDVLVFVNPAGNDLCTEGLR